MLRRFERRPITGQTRVKPQESAMAKAMLATISIGFALLIALLVYVAFTF